MMMMMMMMMIPMTTANNYLPVGSLGHPQKHGDQQKLSLSHEWMPHAWTDDTPTM